MSVSRLLSVHPVMFFCAVVLFLWIGTLVGHHLRQRRVSTLNEESSTFKTLEGAVLALLGLLLGFTFSMAVSRYDLRKNLEIAEANDFTAVWVSGDALPEPVRSEVHDALRQYLPVRILFLGAGTSEQKINESLERTAAIQTQIGSIVGGYAQTHPDPLSAELVNSASALFGVAESRTAAFENRIPVTAWLMLLFIAFIASILVGIGIGSRSQLLRLILPLVVALALSLTLDLDSPRSGLIRVHQLSLERLLERVNTGQMP